MLLAKSKTYIKKVANSLIFCSLLVSFFSSLMKKQENLKKELSLV